MLVVLVWLDAHCISYVQTVLQVTTSTQTKDEVKSGLLLNVVVGKGTSVLKLLAGKDEALLVRGDAFLILNLGLDLLNGVARFDFESDGLSSEGLDENLHTSAQTQYQVKGGLLLNVVVGKGTSVLKLLAGKDEALLVRGDAFLILNLGLDLLNGVARFDFKGDSLASKSLNEDLHDDDVLGKRVDGRMTRSRRRRGFVCPTWEMGANAPAPNWEQRLRRTFRLRSRSPPSWSFLASSFNSTPQPHTHSNSQHPLISEYAEARMKSTSHAPEGAGNKDDR